jgi:hypothetical protein
MIVNRPEYRATPDGFVRSKYALQSDELCDFVHRGEASIVSSDPCWNSDSFSFSDPILPFRGSVPGLRRFELQKCFSFQAVYVRLYRQTVQQRERET